MQDLVLDGPDMEANHFVRLLSTYSRNSQCTQGNPKGHLSKHNYALINTILGTFETYNRSGFKFRDRRQYLVSQHVVLQRIFTCCCNKCIFLPAQIAAEYLGP